jgi:hypothetical protein
MLNHSQEPIDRDLRLQIARVRRRMNGRIHAIEHNGRELLSWRTYVRRYPGYAAGAALGLGLVAAAGLWRGRLPRWLGRKFLRQATDRVVRDVWREVRQFLTRFFKGTEDETPRE